MDIDPKPEDFWAEQTQSYFTISNEELAEMPPLKIGDAILCPNCGGSHIVEGGKDMRTGEVTDELLVYTCGDKQYLAGVRGTNVMLRLFK